MMFGCSEKEDFPHIGTNIAGPIDVVQYGTDNGGYFYVLNSDFEWKYDEGSLLVLNASGEKLKAHVTPRLGKGMQIAGSRMLVFFDRPDQKSAGSVSYYELGNPEDPELKKTWPINCTPVSVALDGSYDYFFVSCIGGQLYIGSFTTDLFKRVRNYERTRKALYLDTQRELLLGFATDLDLKTVDDILEKDTESYNLAGDLTEGANEVPDSFEATKTARRQKSRRTAYQYFVYNIKKEGAVENEPFPYRVLNDLEDAVPTWESRWLYFNLEGDETQGDDNNKYYRTNFVKALKDPSGSDSFYLSHRGTKDDANNVIHVSIQGDLEYKEANNDTCEENYRLDRGACIPLTSHVLGFTRVYGGSDTDSNHYAGDFVIQKIDQKDVLVTNHFRDLVYWKPEERRFSIARKVIQKADDTSTLTAKVSEQQSTSHHESFYTVAVNSEGNGMTCSFYGNKLLLLTINAEDSESGGVTIGKSIY